MSIAPPDPTGLPAALAALDALVDWERQPRAGLRLASLEPVSDLLGRLGNPHRAGHTVHVTGTKGKSGTSALIAAALHGAGWRVFTYLSPHLQRLNERYRIDDTPVDDALLAVALHAALQARRDAAAAGSAGAAATHFDVLTAAGFDLARRCGAAWRVIEVGLGGRLDSTNVVQPEVAVITQVGLEHTEVLGPRLVDIAAQKAGIVKPGCTVVTGEPPHSDAHAVIAAMAHQLGAVLISVAFDATAFDDRSAATSTATSTAATAADRNAALARAVLQALGERGHASPRHGRPLGAADLDDAARARARLPGRLELRRVRHAASGREVVIAIDGAHVEDAVRLALEALALEPATAGAPAAVLLALAADKDAEAIVHRLQGRIGALITAPLAAGRPAWAAADLAAMGQRLGMEAVAVESVREGLAAGVERAAQAGGWLLVIGSLHLAGQARQWLAASLEKSPDERRDEQRHEQGTPPAVARPPAA